MKNFAIIIVLSLIFPNACKQHKEFKQKIESGKKALDSKDLPSAIKYFDEAIKIKPKLPDGYYGVGVAYCKDCFNNGMHCDTALFYLNKVKEINPKYRNTYYNLAVCKVELRNYAGALDDINNAIRTNPNDTDYWGQRAGINIGLKNYNEACKDYKKGIDLGSKRAQILYDKYCK